MQRTRGSNSSELRKPSTPKAPHMGTVHLGHRDETQRRHIVEYLLHDVPVTLFVKGLDANIGCAISKEMTDTSKGQPKRLLWRSWCHDSFGGMSAVQPQLATVLDEDMASAGVWNRLCTTLGGFGDPITGVTMVGNTICNAKSITTPAHWHAPPVINYQVFGAAYKTYKFKRWTSMTKEQKEDRKRFDEPDFTAEIGPGKEANCVIFPSGMLHEITTCSTSLPKQSFCDLDVDTLCSTTCEAQLYLGYGTYFLFEDVAFFRHVTRIMIECRSYPAWFLQLSKVKEVAHQVSQDMINAWKRRIPGMAGDELLSMVPSDPNARKSTTEISCLCGRVLERVNGTLSSIVRPSLPCSFPGCGAHTCYKCAAPVGRSTFTSGESADDADDHDAGARELETFRGYAFCEQHRSSLNDADLIKKLQEEATDRSIACCVCYRYIVSQSSTKKVQASYVTRSTTGRCIKDGCTARICMECAGPRGALYSVCALKWWCDDHSPRDE